MSLARIITRNPQGAFAVSEYLRSEGYTVETVSPGEFRITPAELELDLNRCRNGEALDRAKALVASRNGAAPSQTETPALPEPAPQKAKVPIAYDIVGRPVAFADEEKPERQQNPKRTPGMLASLFRRATAPVRGFQQGRAEKRALKLEAETSRRREQELARERALQQVEQRRAEAELAEQRRQEQVAAEQQAEQERARAALVRAAGISAAREAARKEQAQSMAAENTPEQQRAEPASTEKPVRQPFPRRKPAPLAAARRPAFTAGKAVAIGCAAGILVVLGLVANANRRPASPLSPGALIRNTSLQQDVPLGPVTITPPAAALPKPRPGVNRRILPAVRPAQAKPGPSRRRTSSQADADDVVVRHLQPPSSNPQPTASTASPKQHSDTD